MSCLRVSGKFIIFGVQDIQMGFFLSSLQSETTTFIQKARRWTESLEKVRQYHGVFKSVCDTFVIRKEQFNQIFGNEDKLVLWQGSATINALQVFCGLGFYSSCAGFRLKLKFLFSLFDFNEIKSISVVDLEYMILSILNFTYRILGRTNSRADELRLAEWLMRFVNPHKRININDLARFCRQSEQARSFLQMSNNLEETMKQQSSQVYDQQQDMKESERLALFAQRKQAEINTKLSWFCNFSQKLTKPKYKKEVISTCSLTWAYGIELNRYRVPFLVLCDGRILYAISSKMVIYCPSAKSQSIYARHSKQVEGFAIYEPNSIVASSQGQKSPKIYIWDYRTLETQHIVRIDHSHRAHLLAFSPTGLLAVVGMRQCSPVVLFNSHQNFALKASFAVQDAICELVPFFTPLEMKSLPDELVNIFVLGGKRSIIVVDDKNNQHVAKYDTDITSIAVSYMSQEQPFRRYFTGQSLRLYIVTAHDSGYVNVTIFDPSKSTFEKDKHFTLFKYEEPPKHIILTAQAFLVVLSKEVRVYDLNVLALHQEKIPQIDACRIVKESDVEHLRLLSRQYLFAAINNSHIFLVTTEGDFLQIGDREVEFDGTLREQQCIRRLDEFVKLGGKLKALCFAEREGRGTILMVSQNKKIFQIDPQSHCVCLMLQISYNDIITVIDYAISEEGPAYLVCGSQSGRLLVRIDEEQVAKVYDCQSEITDLKISRDASYLLIATLNSVMFFQLLPSFSSPRKITFENESPVSLNFLDNPRFCSVGTSAKNIYLIEVPQLRHRNVQKDNESFSVTSMAVDFPHRVMPTTTKPTYTRCFVGGDMKFYLLALSTGELLYFPSMSSLPHKNYLIIMAHQCCIANVVISHDQSLFYTIGESDSMMLEWSVREQRPKFVGKRVKQMKDVNPLSEARSMDTFSRMRLVSQVIKDKETIPELCTFFFKGTRSEKLNRRIHEYLKLNVESLGDEELALMKRHCRAYLKINAVYGLQSNRYGQVRYLSSRADDNRLLYSTSRFLVETEGQGRQKERIYETATQIAYFSLSEIGEPIYAQYGQCPRIFVAGVEAVRTLHKNGLIHFTLHGQFVLSFGLEQDCFSINLHNYRTRQLIAQRTTYHPIIQFLMLSPQDFISLHEVRIWHGLIASQALGVASSGAVLPGRKDICLGGMQGELLVLSANGLFELASNAHSKEIIAIQVNQLDTSFEIITASLDESIKIWNEYFESIHTIYLSVPGEFKVLRDLDTLGTSNSSSYSQGFVVRSLDCKGHKILLATTMGQVWEYEVTSREEKVHENQDLNSSDNISSESNGDLNEEMPSRSQRIQMKYYEQKKRLLNAHSSNAVLLKQRYVAFDVHLQLPLFVSAGSDGKLTFREYARQEVLISYVCDRDQRIKVRAVKFSPKGRMLIVGLTTGATMTFFMDISYNSARQIIQLQLKHFQTLKMEEGGPYEVIAIQFNELGDMFAVSYALDPSFKRQRSIDPRQSAALIRVYKTKSQKNQNTDEAFYQPRDEIRLRQEESSGKAFRFAVKLQFETQQNKTYLFLAEEYFDNQGIRLFSTRGKHSIYCLQDKGFLSDQYSISWDKFAFSSLVNLRYHDPKTDQAQENYTITSMLRWKDILIYGGYDGKLHLLRLQSLAITEEASQCRLSDMCLSRIYSALTSPVTQLRIGEANQQRFLFVGGYGDECVLKMELIQEEPAYFLEHQPYPVTSEDPLREFLGKEHFYLTINNRQPLREQLSNILEDVESQSTRGLHLQFVKAFGRRAIDRRYNLTYFDDNLLYCLGPNLVVESLKQSKQYLLKADPSPFSHCPQISAFHFNHRFLIVATQQQRSSIYVWDVKSKSCISKMSLESSFVLIIRFISDNCAVYYGINDKYEPVVALIDWRNSRTLASMRLAFSGLSVVRDLTPITPHENQLTNGGKQFVTCGYLHLCWWEMRGDNLVYHNFNSQSVGSYLCVKQLNGYIITGCEEGHIYLWHQRELIHILHNAHSAAVRCLEVDYKNEIIISGGKDGLLLFLTIEQSKLAPFNRVELAKVCSNSQIEEQQAPQSFKIDLQVQSLAPSPSTLQNEKYDHLLVGTRNGNIFQVIYNDQYADAPLICQHHDNQTVVSATFSAYDSQSFFTLTNAGLVERYNIKTLKRTTIIDLGQRAIKIQACQRLLLVCCRQEILAYYILVEQNQLERSKQFFIDAKALKEEGKDVEITRFCLSKSTKILALCMKNCEKEPTYQISIFSFKGELLHQLSNLKHQIDYLDFSIDDKYLLFKDHYQEIGMVSLDKEYRKINTIFVEMGIEWQQEALRLSPSAQSIYYSYSCENKITTLARLGPDKLIVGDQMGTVRIFDYPCPDDKLGELHLHCYCVHMNDIAEIVVHPQMTHVVTIGLQDRSIVLWRVAKQ